MAWHYDKDKITYFAETDFRGQRVKFGIREEDRARHMYVIGKTGMGKSTLLENLAVQDIVNDEGLCFIDPHGGSAELLLKYVPEHRIKDVIYFAPHEMDFPVALNVLENDDPNKRPLIASGILSTFKKVWPDAWSGRMEYFLMNTLLALLETPGSTLLGVNRMYSDKDYREKVIANITDTSVRAFWVDEYANMTEKMVAEATPAIQNKVGQFSMNPIMRNILGQSESTFDIRWIMDNRKIFIVNLSKGRMGETNAALLGALLVTKIYLAAMSRADLSEGDLKVAAPFHLYVDEFQNFANDSFANILSEARKYKLALTIAHQYIEQMPEEVRDAVFGNVGTMITYRVGAADAEVLEKEFAPVFTMEDIVGLGFAQIYLKLMIKGAASAPFSARTADKPPAPTPNFEAEVRAASREQFGRPREAVEEVIKVWFTSDKSKGGDDGRPGVKKFAPGQRPPFGAGSGGGSGGGYSAGPRTGTPSAGSAGFERRGETRTPPQAAHIGQKAESVSLRDALATAGLASASATAAVVPSQTVEATVSVTVVPAPLPDATTPAPVLAPASAPTTATATPAPVIVASVPVPTKPMIAPIARQIERAALRPQAVSSTLRAPLRTPVPAAAPLRERAQTPAPVRATAPVRAPARAALEEEDKEAEEELLPSTVVARAPQVQEVAQPARTPVPSAALSMLPAPNKPQPQVRQAQAPQRAQPVEQLQQPQYQQPQQSAQPSYPPQPHVTPQYQPQYAPQYQPQYAPQYQQPYQPQYQPPQYSAPQPIYPQYAYPPQPQPQYGYTPFYQPHLQTPQSPQQQFYQPHLQAPQVPQYHMPQPPMYQPQAPTYQPPIYQPYPPMIHYSEPPVPTAGMMSPPLANPIAPVTRAAPAISPVILREPFAPEEAREEKREERTIAPDVSERSRSEVRTPPPAQIAQKQESKHELREPREVRREEPRAERKDARREAPKTLVREHDGKGPSDEKLDALAAALAKLNANFGAQAPSQTSQVETNPEVKEVPLDVLKKVLES